VEFPKTCSAFQKCEPSIRRNASQRINDGYFTGLLEGDFPKKVRGVFPTRLSGQMRVAPATDSCAQVVDSAPVATGAAGVATAALARGFFRRRRLACRCGSFSDGLLSRRLGGHSLLSTRRLLLYGLLCNSAACSRRLRPTSFARGTGLSRDGGRVGNQKLRAVFCRRKPCGRRATSAPFCPGLRVEVFRRLRTFALSFVSHCTTNCHGFLGCGLRRSHGATVRAVNQ
jgi:hypothetical protein